MENTAKTSGSKKARAARSTSTKVGNVAGLVRSGKSPKTSGQAPKFGVTVLRSQAGAVAFYKASPGERVELIRKGVPAIRIEEIVHDMSVSKEHLYGILALPRATTGRKIREGAMLSTDQAERVLGLERLIGQVAVMVEQSGSPEGFNAARWVGDWLEQPISALGGAKPADYMDTREGQELLSRLLAQSQAGVFG